MCRGARGLNLSSKGLHATVSRDDHVLQGLIQAAASGGGECAPPSIRIANAEGKHLIVVVTRTRAADFLTISPDAIVAVFISDPEKHPRPQARFLCGLFGLTGAESRLAILLVQGNTLQDSADRLDVTPATVRSQLMQVFQKTGTSRQSQLVSLLLRLQLPES
jgi:DNA-binding CsgD family transcriptional regulator